MPTIYPIGGGKGGVGKSFVAASLGAVLALTGKSVVLVDLDLGASNLHTFLGMPAPDNGLNRYLDKSASQLAQVAVPTHVDKLSLISSTNCSMEIANLFYAQKVKLINAIVKLPFDCILIDLGAGTNFNTLDFFLASHRGIFVCTPEPTSIENTFRFIKAVYLRKLKQIIKRDTFNIQVKTSITGPDADRLNAGEIFDMIAADDPANMPVLKDGIGRFHFSLVLNQFRRSADVRLGDKITTVCNRHFYSPFEFLGQVDFDERVIDSIYTRKPYIDRFPGTRVAKQIEQIADNLTTRPTITTNRQVPS